MSWIFRRGRQLTLVAAAALLGGLSFLGGPGQVAASAVYQKGDVLAAVGGGKIAHYNPAGTLLDLLDTGSGSTYETGMCFDAAGNLYATNFSSGDVSKFDNAGNLVKYPWARSLSNPESCVRDAAGNFYVGQAGANVVGKFDANGNQLASYAVATDDRGTDWLDLAADQCTLYYTSEGPSVKRFNVCTGVQLPDFATGLPQPCYALRIRSNGEVLVACGSGVQRLSSNGLVTQTYSTTSVGEPSFFFALNLDPDGMTFWTGGYDSNVYRLDILTGKVITHFTAQLHSPALTGLTVFGEQTAAVGPGKRPVIFVPGIGGSEIVAKKSDAVIFPFNGDIHVTAYNQGDVLWLDQVRVIAGAFDQSYLGALQFKSDGTPLIDDFKAGNMLNVSIAGSKAGYPDVVSFFTSNGYTQNQDFFVLPYDWRFSAQDHAGELDALVKKAHDANPGSDGVDIVAHSMGSQVTRAFLTPRFGATNTGLVRHVVLLGSPQLGTPKGSYTTISGVCLPGNGGLFSCAIPADTVKGIFQTIPGGLDQAISSMYRQVMDGHDAQHPLPFADLRSSPPLTDYNTLVQRELDAGTSQVALNQASALHADDATWLQGQPYNVSFVAGTGLCTMGQIVEKYALELGPLKLGTSYDFGEIDGDGTVVRKSATLDDGRLFSNPNVAIYYRPGVEHGALPGAGTLPDALALLQDKVVDHGPMVTPMNCKALSVHSPMEIQVTDASGHRLGATVPKQVRAEIPNADYEAFQDMKVVTFQGAGRFTATLTGTATGEGTVKFRTITQDGVSQLVLFAHVPASPQSRGTLTLDTGAGTVSDLTVDVNGDGRTIVTIHPYTLSAAAAQDTTPPSITIDSPTAGQAVVGTFNLGWTATDAGAGVATSAAMLDASTPGARRVDAPGPVSLAPGVHTVDVFADDRAGNPATATRTFTAYGWSWQPPLRVGFSGKAGRTIPTKFSVTDLSGAFVADSTVTVDVVDAAGKVVVAARSAGSDPESTVAIDGGQYHANLSTVGLSPGSYTIRARFNSATLTGELDEPIMLS